MNDYNLKKNAEGYADPTAAATLTRQEPGEVWEYNGAPCLIIKNHGSLSTILRLSDRDHPRDVKVTTSEGVKYADARLLTYGQHTKMGQYTDTLSRSDFANVITAVEDALEICVKAEENAEPVDTLAEIDAQEVQTLQERLATAQALLEAQREQLDAQREQLEEYTAITLGLEKQLIAAQSHINNGAVNKAEAEATKAKNQLELLRDMYNELLTKVVEGVE